VLFAIVPYVDCRQQFRPHAPTDDTVPTTTGGVIFIARQLIGQVDRQHKTVTSLETSMTRLIGFVGLVGALMLGTSSSRGKVSAQIDTQDDWTTVCTIKQDGSPLGKTVAWNANTRKAKITHFDGPYPGRVTRSQSHGAGRKLNLRFEYGERYGMNESEYIVFPMPGSGHRIVGVAFIRDGGDRHLQNLEGVADANCITP
jgi:hypothetical protein